MTKGQVLKFKSIDEYMDGHIDKIEVKSGFIKDKLIMKKLRSMRRSKELTISLHREASLINSRTSMD